MDWKSTKDLLESDREIFSKPQPTYKSDDKGIHRYEFVIADVSWDQARTACNQAGGYLVRINSKEEWDYLMSEIQRRDMQDKTFWINAARNEYGSYTWQYDTGNPYCLDDDLLYGSELRNMWYEGEPSYIGKAVDGEMVGEYCVDMFYYEEHQSYVLNDVPNDIMSAAPFLQGGMAYICEFDY